MSCDRTIIILRRDAPVHEVKLFRDGSRKFWATFNVTELEEGGRLFVSNFLARDGSRPPGIEWWRAQASRYFPVAEWVTFERWRATGMQTRTFKIYLTGRTNHPIVGDSPFP